MNCMKCGRETAGEQAFCEECLLDMEKYPVRPGTLVQLPKRPNTTGIRRPAAKRRTVPLEEQVKSLKKRLRLVTLLLVLFILLSALLAVPAVQYLMEDHFEMGQNYKSIVTTTAPTETEVAD